MNETYEEIDHEEEPLVEWVLLEAGDITLFLESPLETVSPSFLERCRDAGGHTLDIARLRREHRRVGFVPLPLSEYVDGLIKLAGLSDSASLERLAGLDRAGTDQGEAPYMALAQLAKKIGLTMQDALLHARIQIATHVAPAPLPLLLAHRRSTDSGKNQQEECQAILKQIESQYDALALSELREKEYVIRKAYTAAGSQG